MEKECLQVTENILKIAVSKEHDILPENISIEDIHISAGSRKGEGFVCEIAAVKFTAIINGEKFDKNYIAKYAPPGAKGDFIREMNAFEQETFVYNLLIPALQSLREDRKKSHLAFAKCFYASNSEQLILLENLKAQNFITVEKKPEPLSLSAVKLVLKELAAFHATGHYFVKNFSDISSLLTDEDRAAFEKNMLKRPEDVEHHMQKFLDMIYQAFSTSILVMKTFGTPEMSSKMEAYHSRLMDTIKAIFLAKPRFTFITHGDAWFSNFLFRFSPDNKVDPKDLKIVDLQNTRLGRPGLDLAYFLCSSSSPNQRKEHFDHLLRLYYDTFFEELKSLGDDSEPYFTFEDLETEYNECYPFGFVMGFAHSQVLLVKEDSEASFDLEAMTSPEAAQKMVKALQEHVIKEAKKSPEYLAIFMGLAEEGLQKNIL